MTLSINSNPLLVFDMKRRTVYLHLFFYWFVCLCGLACNSASQSPEAEPREDQVVELSEAEKAELLCLESGNSICQSGIGIGENGEMLVRIGDFIGDILPEGEFFSIEDSVEEQEGFIWAIRTIHDSQGTVILEGNFIDVREQALDSLLQESTVNRIRVLNSLFRTPIHLGVGSSFSELLAVFDATSLGLVHLPDFGYIDIQVDQSRIHYLLSDEFLPEYLDENGIVPSSIPAEARIGMIVVM